MPDEADRSVRKYVFDYFLKQAFAPSLEEIAADVGLTRSQTFASLQRLEAGHHLKLLNGTERILMAYPFSAISTPHRVTRRNRQRYFANCAWDAIAFHPMLGEPVDISSFCHHCTTPIRFRLASGHGVPVHHELPVVFLALPAAQWWNDIVRTCSNTMVFFQSPSHLKEWGTASERNAGATLSVDQAVAISLPIYGEKMEVGYDRPSKQELQAKFESLGLTGAFWQL